MVREEELEVRTANLSRQALYDPALISGIHAALYNRLPESDRVTDEWDEAIVPGRANRGWETGEGTGNRGRSPM